MIERPARSLKIKNLQTPQMENEGILQTPPETVRQAGLILLFDGEVGRSPSDRDEHSQTDILTSASYRLPAFPICIGGLGNL